MKRTIDEETRGALAPFLEGAAGLAVAQGRARRTVAVARLASKLAQDGLGRLEALSYAGTLLLGLRGRTRPK